MRQWTLHFCGYILAFVLSMTAAWAQSGGYQNAQFLGYKPVVNGQVCDPIYDQCSDRHVQAYIVDAAGFRYLVAKPSDAGVAPIVRSPLFSRRDSDFLDKLQPGAEVHIRVEGKKMHVQDGEKSHDFLILSVGPAPSTSLQPPPAPAAAPGAQPDPVQRLDQATDMRGGVRPQYERCVGASGGKTNELLTCNAEEEKYQESRLNSIYQNLLAEQGADAQDRTRQAERDWVTYRDKKCDIHDFGGGTADDINRTSCMVRETTAQADKLQVQLDGSSRR
jgi:uncharacterized protein YecT (DUF1311 family)